MTAANLTDIANAVEPYRERLPVVTQEIGDTWISGVPSDPLKVARYLEVARLRSQWIGSGKFQAGDATDRAFLSGFLLEVEHTWGADIKTWLDFDHYLPQDLEHDAGAAEVQSGALQLGGKAAGSAGCGRHAARAAARRGDRAHPRA